MELQTLLLIYKSIAVVLLLVIVSLLIRYYKRLNSYVLFPILAYSSILFVEIITYFNVFNYKNTGLVYSFFTSFLSLLFQMIFFYFNIKNSKMKKISLMLITLHIANFGLGFYLNEDSFLLLKNHFISIALLFCIIMMYLYETFNSDIILKISKHFSFWNTLYVIIVWIGLLPVLVLSQYREFIIDAVTYYTIINMVSFIGYSSLIFGIYKTVKK